jgi:hypothetical protein
MSTLEIDIGDIRPVSVAFTADEIVVTLADGRRIATRLRGTRGCGTPALRRAGISS